MNTLNTVLLIMSFVSVVSLLFISIVDIRAYRRLNKRLDDIEEKYKGSEK